MYGLVGFSRENSEQKFASSKATVIQMLFIHSDSIYSTMMALNLHLLYLKRHMGYHKSLDLVWVFNRINENTTMVPSLPH